MAVMIIVQVADCRGSVVCNIIHCDYHCIVAIVSLALGGGRIACNQRMVLFKMVIKVLYVVVRLRVYLAVVKWNVVSHS